jgi:hypothetical protein
MVFAHSCAAALGNRRSEALFFDVPKPAAALVKIKKRSTDHDAQDATRYFLNRILNLAVAIGRE